MRGHHSLEPISALHPRTIVAGHKGIPSLSDSPEALAFIHNYLNSFESPRRKSTNDALVATMRQEFPSLIEEKFLGLRSKSRVSKKWFMRAPIFSMTRCIVRRVGSVLAEWYESLVPIRPLKLIMKGRILDEGNPRK